MFGTGFEHKHFIVLQDDFGLHDFQTPGTEAVGEVVIDIRTIMTNGERVLEGTVNREGNGWFLALSFTFAHCHLLLVIMRG